MKLDAEKTLTQEMTGGNVLVSSLKQQGVTHLFGYPGGSVLSLFDAMYDQQFNCILVRHSDTVATTTVFYAVWQLLTMSFLIAIKLSLFNSFN